MRLLLFSLAIILTALTTIFSADFMDVGIFSWKLDWFATYLLPIAIVISLTLLCCNIVWHALKQKTWIKLVVVLVVGTLMALPYFLVNPIYIQDIQKQGEEIRPHQFDGNTTFNEIIQNHPDFDGVLAIANVDCDHCKASMKNLKELVSRNDQLDVVVYVYTLKDEKLKAFVDETNAHELEFHLSPDEESLIKLCDGAFPSFFYIRHGDIVQKWYNDQFGFRALAWIDNGLKD